MLVEQYQESERRADYRCGVLASLTANINRDREKQPTPYTPEDFFPTGATEHDELQAERQAYAALMTWAVAHNTILARKQRNGP